MQNSIVPASPPAVFDDGTTCRPVGAAQGPGSSYTPSQGPSGPPGPAQGLGWALAALLFAARRWLLWCWGELNPVTGKRAKVPYYAGGRMRTGPLDTPEDTSRLVSNAEALAAARRLPGVYAGLGFALGDGWQGIDLDNVAHNGLSDLAHALPSYVELSPSGKGCHALGYGRPFATLAPDKTTGIEAYAGKRFFTFTGEVISFGPIVCLADFVEQRLVTRHRGASMPLPAHRLPDEPATLTDDEVMHRFWYARNAERFHALWFGDLRAYGGDHSRADQALMTQLAFYGLNDEQVVRLFRLSPLGQRAKAYREDYIDRTLDKARATHAPRLARTAAAQNALGPALDAAMAKGGAR